ncbi:MAG: hypothetical protein ACOZBH_01445 [Patescibacteria group bacterium]
MSKLVVLALLVGVGGCTLSAGPPVLVNTPHYAYHSGGLCNDGFYYDGYYCRAARFAHVFYRPHPEYGRGYYHGYSGHAYYRHHPYRRPTVVVTDHQQHRKVKVVKVKRPRHRPHRYR